MISIGKFSEESRRLRCGDHPVPDIQTGQYTIIHAGFALKIIDEAEAAESLKLWHELIESGAFQPDEEPPSPESL